MLITFLVYAAVSVLFLAAFLVWLFWSRQKGTSVPGLDSRSAVSGNWEDIQSAGSLHDFLLQLHHQFGDVASFWWGQQMCVSVASADAFNQLQHLFDRPDSLFGELLPLVGEESLFFLHGQLAMQRQQMYSRILNCHTEHTSPQLLPRLVSVCEDMVTVLKLLPEEEHVPVHEYMLTLAANMLMKTQFGAGHIKDVKQLLSQLQAIVRHLDDIKARSIAGHEYLDLLDEVEQRVTLLKQRLAPLLRPDDDDDDTSSALLKAIVQACPDEDRALNESILFMLLGVYTTANCLTWIMYFLALHPEVQKKALLEVDMVLQGRPLSHELAAKLAYVWQVLEEGLRISFSVPFAARVSRDQDVQIQGHTVPAGTPIICALNVAASNADIFADPGKFDPNRFSLEQMQQRPAQSCPVFGIGRRRCPASKIARFHLLSWLVTLLQHFSFKPAFDEDIFVQPVWGVVTQPETEVWLRLKKRIA